MKTVLFYLDFGLAPLGAALLAYYHFSVFGFSLTFASLFAAGWVLWTLIEFFVHRMTHEASMFKKEHFFHHRKPLAYTGPSSFVTIVLYGIIWIVMDLVFGRFISTSLMPGLLTGYGFYISLHAIIHRGPSFPLGLFAGMKEHHERHHKGKPNTFGVTTSFWDWVWRKLFP